MKIATIVGARPQFIKAAAVSRVLRKSTGIREVLIHTGQHYDPEMSEAFFRDLQIPEPDYNLGVGSATHSVQTARIMERFEPVCEKESPDCIVLFGDVNSTVACALVGAKNHVRIAHVEAGLRSFDRSMPEEINRVVTDVLSDYLFATDAVAVENLRREGIPEERILMVGDIMVDALFWGKERAKTSTILERFGLAPGSYAVATLHRAANVDNFNVLSGLLQLLTEVSRHLTVVFPVHPRTKARLREFGLLNKISGDKKGSNNLIIIKPVGYIDFIRLIVDSKLVLTDSGGLQKETTLLGIPCLTLRDTTEWPLTVSQGTNRLLGSKPPVDKVLAVVKKILSGGERREITLPKGWDGRTAERILHTLVERLD